MFLWIQVFRYATLYSWISGFQLFKGTYFLNLQRCDPVTQHHNWDLNPYGHCYEKDSNLKHVPLVNISGFTAVLILTVSPGDNDLPAHQLALFADMKNQKFKDHNNERNPHEEKNIFIHSIGMCRMRWFLAVLRSFFHSSLSYTFLCHSSPPIMPPSSLTSSSHLFLGLPLGLVVFNFIQMSGHKFGPKIV